MATEFETEAQPQVSSLIAGIVQDARQLIVEQLTLFQVEIKNDVRRLLIAIIPLIAGAIVGFAGLLILLMGAAYFVCWAIPDLPLWGGFAAIGGFIVAVAAGLLFWGKTKLSNISPLPDTALEGLKENLQWKTKK
jgi:hypothetical protein